MNQKRKKKKNGGIFFFFVYRVGERGVGGEASWDRPSFLFSIVKNSVFEKKYRPRNRACPKYWGLGGHLGG